MRALPMLMAIAAPAPVAGDNAEMTRIYDADQAARQDAAGFYADWRRILAADAERRKRTKALLDAGAVLTAEDFYHAAYVFQHGDRPDDFLLAHSLAVTAIAGGKPEARWIAAATLDRYLQAIGRPQVYGTQFLKPPGRPATQEPFDRALIGDAQRRAADVPPLAEQEAQRRGWDAEWSKAPRRP